MNFAFSCAPKFLGDERARFQIIPFRKKAESSDADPRRRRVLVVDDERLIADTTREILAGAGFDAIAAYDGSTALELASSFSPDYVLSDVLMPRMNGVEFAIAISGLLPSTKVLLFSGQAGISEILEQGRERGYHFDLIAKPVHPLALIERLKSL